jgi:G:T-mismatch repair DNA endonuclease (very short patch repair protein)
VETVENRLPDVPNLSVGGFCVETGTVYEFLGCFWHGHTCLHFRDVTTASGETLAERYEQTAETREDCTGRLSNDRAVGMRL